MIIPQNCPPWLCWSKMCSKKLNKTPTCLLNFRDSFRAIWKASGNCYFTSTPGRWLREKNRLSLKNRLSEKTNKFMNSQLKVSRVKKTIQSSRKNNSKMEILIIVSKQDTRKRQIRARRITWRIPRAVACWRNCKKICACSHFRPLNSYNNDCIINLRNQCSDLLGVVSAATPAFPPIEVEGHIFGSGMTLVAEYLHCGVPHLLRQIGLWLLDEFGDPLILCFA